MKGTRRKTRGSTRCGLTLRAWSGHIIIRSILNRVWLDDASFPSSFPLPNTHRFTLNLPAVLVVVVAAAAAAAPPVAALYLHRCPTILRGSLNRQQFQPLNNSWRSNLTANKLDRISRDLERASKPLSATSDSLSLPQPCPHHPFYTLSAHAASRYTANQTAPL